MIIGTTTSKRMIMAGPIVMERWSLETGYVNIAQT